MGAIHEYGYSIEVLPLVEEVRLGVDMLLGPVLRSIRQPMSCLVELFQKLHFHPRSRVSAVQQPEVLFFISSAVGQPTGCRSKKRHQEISDDKPVQEPVIHLIRIAEQAAIARSTALPVSDLIGT